MDWLAGIAVKIFKAVSAGYMAWTWRTPARTKDIPVIKAMEADRAYFAHLKLLSVRSISARM